MMRFLLRPLCWLVGHEQRGAISVNAIGRPGVVFCCPRCGLTRRAEQEGGE
jgi:hypothetical protein